MVDNTYKANSIFFEDKYVQWADVGIPEPGSELLSQGTLYVTGKNNVGELGLNDRTHRSSPVQVGSFSNWNSILSSSTGNETSTAAIRTNGTLWAWGYNLYGQLGLNDTTSRSSPVQVGSLSNWKNLSSGISGYSILAIKTDGTLWAWGQNFPNPALGLNDRTHRSSPVQVGSLTNWSQVVTSSSGASLAVKTDGTLWGWGGDGFNVIQGYYSSPVQIGSLTNWKTLSLSGGHIAAIKTDGTLWAWGKNTYGQLGLGFDTSNKGSPVQVGTATDWAFISCGGLDEFNHTLAIKTNGTLWAWGYNESGRLGLNDTTNRSFITQVGTLTNWGKVYCGGNHTISIKTDGTLWGWGRNDSGQLGLGDTNQRLSPVQVGTLTDWSISAQGTSKTLALRKRYNYT